ncbi:cytidine/deoxycytidylate deaminase family protein [bacterium]|nr:cytidine/deoxycytidylate deaminase family protein [bacterium]
MSERPSWDDYFMKMAMLVSERSTCLRRHVGAVLVRDRRVLSTGYNGAARGLRDCRELGCLRDEQQIESGTRHEVCRAIHAEQNAIIQAGLHGVSIGDSTMYCTHSPCFICAKMIINAGIRRVVSSTQYSDRNFPGLFEEAGVDFEVLPLPDPQINFKP